MLQRMNTFLKIAIIFVVGAILFAFLAGFAGFFKVISIICAAIAIISFLVFLYQKFFG